VRTSPVGGSNGSSDRLVLVTRDIPAGEGAGTLVIKIYLSIIFFAQGWLFESLTPIHFQPDEVDYYIGTETELYNAAHHHDDTVKRRTSRLASRQSEFPASLDAQSARLCHFSASFTSHCTSPSDTTGCQCRHRAICCRGPVRRRQQFGVE